MRANTITAVLPCDARHSSFYVCTPIVVLESDAYHFFGMYWPFVKNEELKDDGIEVQWPQSISYTELYTKGYEERMVSVKGLGAAQKGKSCEDFSPSCML